MAGLVSRRRGSGCHLVTEEGNGRGRRLTLNRRRDLVGDSMAEELVKRLGNRSRAATATARV
jgi:hypothetical protein